MTKDVCIEIVRRRIHSCMEELFNEDSKTAHNIAQDFSKTKLIIRVPVSLLLISNLPDNLQNFD
ncbi:MAG: hypothetical protein O8C59_03415 [Candidatus Methanoperedens sp.]|nr:hypothetical protein [Candidatus Methanoperedens sp.]